MAETACALANSSGPVWYLTSAARAVRVLMDVEDDVIRALRVSADASHSIETVEHESVSDLPSHHMVGARGVSADAEPTNSDSASIKCQSTAKDIHTADAATDHRIPSRAEVLGAALARLETGLAESRLAVSVAVCDTGVNGIAVLQPVEAAARLYRREQVGR